MYLYGVLNESGDPAQLRPGMAKNITRQHTHNDAAMVVVTTGLRVLDQVTCRRACEDSVQYSVGAGVLYLIQQ